MSLNPEQEHVARLGPCFALRFLVQPESRTVAREQMPGVSDAAIFHRWMDLFWTLREPEALALLTSGENALLHQFNVVFESLPWRSLEAFPHISEVSAAERAKLEQVASRLLEALELNQIEPTSRLS